MALPSDDTTLFDAVTDDDVTAPVVSTDDDEAAAEAAAAEAAAAARHDRLVDDLLEALSSGKGVNILRREAPVAPLPEPEPLTPAEAWLAEADAVQKVLARGDVVAVDTLRQLFLAAIPFVQAQV